jgi:hypothetical protein
MPQPIATYITFAEFNGGKPISPQQFREELAKYHRDGVIALCSAMNCLLKTWIGGRVDSKAHDLLTQSAFSDELAAKMKRARENAESPRVVFHRQQLLSVAKEAVLYCKNEGINPLSNAKWNNFGIILLMANDQLPFLFPRADDRDQQLLNTLAEFIPVLEISGPSSMKNKTARAQAMADIAAESVDHPDFIDIAAIFKGVAGMSVREFRALSFGSMTKYMQLDLDQFQKNPEEFFLPRTWFKTAALDPEKVARFLDDVSVDGESLKKKFEKRNAGKSDFTPIRDRPLYATADKLFAADAAFLGEKVETGMFWAVHNSLDGNQRQHLHRFWGHVFQIYMDRLLSKSVAGGKHTYIPSPRYISGGEVCDGLILCGSSGIFLEYKGATFTAESKYSGDTAQLSQALGEKLVTEKGVRQLANAIERLFARGTEDQIADVDISRVRRIFPVLVTRDNIGGALVINVILNRRFDAMLNRRSCRPYVITPLFCMDAEVMEGISSYLQEVRLDDILDARYRGDPRMMSGFAHVSNPVVDAIGYRSNDFVDFWFDQFAKTGFTLLFPGENFETDYSKR